MRGSSADSFGQLSEALASEIAAGAEGGVVGDDLLAGAGALRASAALRRAATDPSSPAEAKSALLAGLFDGKVGAEATKLLALAAGLRWARGSDLVDSIEQLGVVAQVKGADANGDGDQLEDELFSFAQTVAENRDIRDAFSDPARTVADKQALVRALLDGKALPATIKLAERSVTGTHGTVASALAEYSQLAASTRDRVVATVTVAAALTSEEQGRLAAVLTRDYQRPVHLNVVLNPEIVGGIRVEIGDQVIDGTVAARIDDATRLLTGRRVG